MRWNEKLANTLEISPWNYNYSMLLFSNEHIDIHTLNVADDIKMKRSEEKGAKNSQIQKSNRSIFFSFVHRKKHTNRNNKTTDTLRSVKKYSPTMKKKQNHAYK